MKYCINESLPGSRRCKQHTNTKKVTGNCSQLVNGAICGLPSKYRNGMCNRCYTRWYKSEKMKAVTSDTNPGIRPKRRASKVRLYTQENVIHDVKPRPWYRSVYAGGRMPYQNEDDITGAKLLYSEREKIDEINPYDLESMLMYQAKRLKDDEIIERVRDYLSGLLQARRYRNDQEMS